MQEYFVLVLFLNGNGIRVSPSFSICLLFFISLRREISKIKEISVFFVDRRHALNEYILTIAIESRVPGNSQEETYF